MKQLFTLLIILLGSFLSITSCKTDNISTDESDKKVEPGIYYIGMNLNPINDLQTKGVADNNYMFDENYDDNVIYLHKKGTDESIQLPVWACEGCEHKGIRYRICIQEDGSAIITPIDSNGDYVKDQQMTLTKDDECYFSSWPTNEWKIDDEQISSTSLGDENYHFFYRNQTNNKEIYRSKDDLSISSLVVNENLVITRACAGFNLVGLLYESANPITTSNGKTYILEEDEFEEYMESPADEWYIKIYVGGSCYPNQYNIESNTSDTDIKGYYSSGDAAKFETGEIDNQQYIRFSSIQYGIGSNTYMGLGYYTLMGNHLFTPVTGGEELHVYVLIKHWTEKSDPEGSKGSPSTDWLKSDIGALQTEIVGENGNITPTNGNFYTAGLLIDIQQFKEAWIESGGDNWTPESASAVSTKSPSGATVRKFTLKDAKVICDVY